MTLKIRINRKTFVEVVLTVIVMLNMGYGKLSNISLLTSTNATVFLTAIVSLFLGLYTANTLKNRWSSMSRYIALVVFLWMVEMLVSFFLYDNSSSQSGWLSCCRFLDLLLVYPLVYVLEDNDSDFLLHCVVLNIIILFIRQYAWYMYNYNGVSVFPNLLFEFENWARNGLYRCTDTSLSPILMVYSISQLFSNEKLKRKIIYIICIVVTLEYTFFVYASRWTFVVEVFVVGILLWSNSRKYLSLHVFIRRLLLCIIIGVVVFTTSFWDYIISIFGVSGNAAFDAVSSYNIRLSTIYECLQAILKYPLFGLGLMSSSRYDILGNHTTSDAGIIGYIASCGLLGWVSIVGYIRFSFREWRIHNSHFLNQVMSFGVLLIVFFIDCIVSNAFSYQRILEVPFVLAIIYLMHYSAGDSNLMYEENV